MIRPICQLMFAAFVFSPLLLSPVSVGQEPAGTARWVDLFSQTDQGHFARWERLGENKGANEIAKNWRVTEDGWLHLYKPGGHGSSLLLKDEIGDFELSFFWKIKTNANNGIKFRVRDYGGNTLGIEYQLLDDVAQDKTIPRHRTAAMYDLFEPSDLKPLNAAESVNHSRICGRGTRNEHWLNGVLVVEAEAGSEAWNAAVDRSKFKPHEGFGQNEKGRLLFTDHGGEIWFRDVLLRTF